MKPRLLFLFLCGLCLSVNAETPEILGIFRFENQTPPDTAYEAFEQFLGGKISEESLIPGLESRVWNVKFSDLFNNEDIRKTNLRIAVYGAFLPGISGAVTLKFKIMDVKTGIEEEKQIPASGMEQHDIANIVILKIKDFLATSMLAKLNVSSTPLGLSIRIDTVDRGVTPKEFFLPTGEYRLSITGKYLEPFETRVQVSPGKSITVSPEMEFKGYKTQYWLICALFSSWEAAAFWRISNRYPESNAYKYIDISMLTISGVSWIGTAYCYFTNKSLKKRCFAIKN